MPFTVVLSGPQGTLQTVHRSLESAGFRLVLDAGGQPTLHNHGLVPDEPGHQFVTAEGDDINRAHAVVAQHEWRLRAYWNNDDMGYAAGIGSPGYLSPADRLARVEKDIEILRASK